MVADESEQQHHHHQRLGPRHAVPRRLRQHRISCVHTAQRQLLCGRLGAGDLLGAPASAFNGMTGDILRRVSSSYHTVRRASIACTGPARSSRRFPSRSPPIRRSRVQYEDIYFTPLGIGSVPPAPPPTTGLPNWPINLENSSGQVIASTVTDAHGNYAFYNVAAGTYTVAEVQQTGWTQFAPPSPGTYCVTVTSDQVIAGLDFGNSQNNPPAVDPGPVFSSSYVGDTNATVGLKYTYTAVAADTDHDQITYSLGLAKPGMVIDPTLGVLDWTPSANEVGFQNVDIVATDSNGNIATQEYTILGFSGRPAARHHHDGPARQRIRIWHTRTRSRRSRPITIPSPSACPRAIRAACPSRRPDS